MVVRQFPPVEVADEHGLVAVGGDLEVATLKLAYEQGIFPWPISQDLELAWFSPDPRGVLFIDDLHLSKSFKKFLLHHPYTITFNQEFIAVIKNCALVHGQKKIHNSKNSHPDDLLTWITPRLMNAYIDLHKSNMAYSIEVWRGEGIDRQLVGGMYGVNIGKFYSGESMFHLEDNTSKLALYSLLIMLKEKGVPFLDTQMVSPVVKSFGGKEIPRKEFLSSLVQLLKP